MNISTGLSVYNKPWLIEPNAAVQLFDFWERVVSGEANWDYAAAMQQSDNTEPHNKFFAKENVIVAPQSTFGLSDFKGFDGASVAVIPISGPIMKNDYCGSLGTQSLKHLTQMAAQSESVNTIMFLIDSPGGTVDGTQSFANVIKNAGKRTVALVDGMMCSAAYWLGSQANEVYCSSGTDFVGSIGTMCSFVDRSKSMESKGVVLREYYATASTDKNQNYKKAINGDGKNLIEQELDPINDVFLSSVRVARGNKISIESENVFSGKTYIASQAMEYGLVDGITSFEELLSSEIARTNKRINISNVYNKNSNMNLEQFKAEHPEAYAAAVSAGVHKERERVNTWLVYNDIDPANVKAGIESGNDMGTATQADFNRKAFVKNNLAVLEADSAPALSTPATNTPTSVSDEQSEMEKHVAEMKKHLGLGNK